MIFQLMAVKKQELLQELFGSGDNSISISYLRLSIGAVDLNAAPFSYDDVATGQKDVNLISFNLEAPPLNST